MDKPPDEVVNSFINVYNETTEIHVTEFVNESGIVTLGYPEENSPLGYDLYENNQEWAFERARDNRETYISNPTFLLEGGMGGFIWTPIYKADEFKGIVLVIIRISDISDRFLKNCKSPHEIFMIDKQGTILYDSSNRYLWGRNYLEKLGNESPRMQQILHHQMNGSEKRLIAYSCVIG